MPSCSQCREIHTALYQFIIIAGLNRVDCNSIRRHRQCWPAFGKTFRMFLITGIQSLLFMLCYCMVVTCKHLFRRETSLPTVMMLCVVPLSVCFDPQTCMVNILNTTWVIRWVFLRFELTFAIRIIITHSRAAMATGNSQFSHLIKARVTVSSINCLARALFSLRESIHDTI